MKLRRLWIDSFKNLRNCEVTFEHPYFLNSFIGGNGSGKSNLIEAILHIFLDFYLGKTPSFDFFISYETKGREVSFQRQSGATSATLNGEVIPYARLVSRARNFNDQFVFPDSIFAYYSGDCDRVRRQLNRYTARFRRLAQNPKHDNLSPHFVLSTNQQARHILLALVAHHHYDFLERLSICGVRNIKITLKSPKGFNPKEHEPVLWGTSGKVAKSIAAFADFAHKVETRKSELPILENGEVAEYSFSEERTYSFLDDFNTSRLGKKLKDRLEAGQDNLYLALEHLKARNILKSVDYELIEEANQESFDFNQLSEGEKQLISVIGAIRLTTQRDNLILLDEPDTHLNPNWSWEYSEMLEEAFDASQKPHSTVLLATHDPVVISGLVREQVFLATKNDPGRSTFVHPYRHPRGQGIANLLCSSEFFGLPSSLDKKTQILMEERLQLSLKETLTNAEKNRLKQLNERLEILQPGISERDPNYAEFLRNREEEGETTQ